MIYAIGNRPKYDAHFAAGSPGVKLGKGKDGSGRPYKGGSAWQSAEDALAFIRQEGLSDGHLVYGVAANWDRETEQLAGEPFRRS